MEPKFSDILLARADVIMKLKGCGLSLDWLKEYSIPCLLASCDRKEKSLPGVSIADTALERELIENRGFAAWFAKLLPLLPEEPPPEKKPKPVYNVHGSRVYQPPSRRRILMRELRGLLETCTVNGKDITVYSQENVMQMLGEEHVSWYARLVFLENFASAGFPEDMRHRVLVTLHRCVKLPLELTERQKALLVEPYAITRTLFASAPLKFWSCWMNTLGC